MFGKSMKKTFQLPVGYNFFSHGANKRSILYTNRFIIPFCVFHFVCAIWRTQNIFKTNIWTKMFVMFLFWIPHCEYKNMISPKRQWKKCKVLHHALYSNCFFCVQLGIERACKSILNHTCCTWKVHYVINIETR